MKRLGEVTGIVLGGFLGFVLAVLVHVITPNTLAPELLGFLSLVLVVVGAMAGATVLSRLFTPQH